MRSERGLGSAAATRSGLPTNTTPNISCTARSCQASAAVDAHERSELRRLPRDPGAQQDVVGRVRRRDVRHDREAELELVVCRSGSRRTSPPRPLPRGPPAPTRSSETSTVTGPNPGVTPRAAPPSAARTAAATGRHRAIPAEPAQTVDQRLGPRRAAGHVDVDRHDLVDALRDGVGVPVRTARARAGPERDHRGAGGQGCVQLAQRGGQDVGAGARHHEDVDRTGPRTALEQPGLARLGPPERCGHELHRAAGEAGPGDVQGQRRGRPRRPGRRARCSGAGRPGRTEPWEAEANPAVRHDRLRSVRAATPGPPSAVPAEPRRGGRPATRTANPATRGPVDGTRARERGRRAGGWCVRTVGPARSSSSTTPPGAPGHPVAARRGHRGQASGPAQPRHHPLRG